MVKCIDIKLEKDIREENILERDSMGNPTKFKQSEFVVRVELDNGTFWTPDFSDIAKIISLICENEDYKYPDGLMKRNMLFYKYLFPLFEKELLEKGFNPEEGLMYLLDIEKRKNGTTKKEV